MSIDFRINSIGHQMAEIMIRDLKNGSMALNRAREISRYYLDHLRHASDELQLTKHIEHVEMTMPEMHPVVRTEKMRALTKKQEGA